VADDPLGLPPPHEVVHPADDAAGPLGLQGQLVEGAGDFLPGVVPRLQAVEAAGGV